MSDKCCEDYKKSLNELGKFSLEIIRKFNKKFKNETKEVQFHLGVDLLESLIISFFMNTSHTEENIEIFFNKVTSSAKEYINNKENKDN